MSYTLADLKIAHRHVADAERQIVEQEALIARLRLAGLPTSAAERLLAKLHAALERFRNHCAKVQASVEGQD